MVVTIADSMIGRVGQASFLSCFERFKSISSGKQKFARVPTSDGAVEVKPSYHLAVAAWICAWYAVSIVLTLFNKWLFAGFGLKLPLLTTSLHFALKSIVRIFVLTLQFYCCCCCCCCCCWWLSALC